MESVFEKPNTSNISQKVPAVKRKKKNFVLPDVSVVHFCMRTDTRSGVYEWKQRRFV